MRELVVISGKGGTGKTSIVASFAALAGNAVMADCDVDAADLHLVLSPTIRRREEFRCGREAVIRQSDCVRCGACLARCRFDAVRMEGDSAGQATFTIDATACEGCGVCVHFCPAKAIDFPERLSGEWFVSDTRHGPMAHARLIPGGENSGKLVSNVREEARRIAAEKGYDLIIVDGPPGVGCSVIASLTGASLVLIVSEPTLSGIHDMRRVIELAAHFKIPTAVCVNKCDLNTELAGKLEEEARRLGALPVGRVRYDRTVTDAQIQGKAVVELPDTPSGADIRAVWNQILSRVEGK